MQVSATVAPNLTSFAGINVSSATGSQSFSFDKKNEMRVNINTKFNIWKR